MHVSAHQYASIIIIKMGITKLKGPRSHCIQWNPVSLAQRWGQAEPESSPPTPLKFNAWTSEEFPWPKLHQFRIFRRRKVVFQHPEPSDTDSKIKSQASKQGHMILLALTGLPRAANSPCSAQPGFQKDHTRGKSDKHMVASIKAKWPTVCMALLLGQD